jgi:hypothetical protein
MTSNKLQKITVKGLEIVTFKYNESDFISLTDIAKYKDKERTNYIVQNWMRNRNTIEFLGLWEKLNNPNFNSIEFDAFKSQAGLHSFSLTPQRWIENTNAIGLISKSGRYGGGVFAYKDIAFEFAAWISSEFRLFIIKDFQRLKEEENQRFKLGWNIKRTLAKVNYKIHTDAIKQYLIPVSISKVRTEIVYANEADVLNVALFGKTTGQWRDENSGKDGNIRDYADVTQLVVLSNLEGVNAELIRKGLSQSKRLIELNQIAIFQMKSLLGSSSIKKLP